MYEYFIIIKKKKSTRTQNKIMKKGIRKIISKTYWKTEESNGNYWEVEQKKIGRRLKKWEDRKDLNFLSW